LFSASDKLLVGTPAYRQSGWDISFLADNPTIRSKRFGIPKEVKGARYPIRLLRYWFMGHLLCDEAKRLGRGMDIAEVGVHSGQMLEFYRSMPGAPEPRRWTAYDAVVLSAKLAKAGYGEIIEANIENPGFGLGGEYDVAIVLHILEHLIEPEAALERVACGIRPGGAVIGGFPVLPHPLIANRQQQIRKTAAPMGHVSVFSPRRVRTMAESCGLRAEFMAGAYSLRSKGGPLENSAWWMRWNILWGACFPWWPGEIYWLLRKPE
jgi:hypothetical protein